jgi:hypothetical protein
MGCLSGQIIPSLATECGRPLVIMVHGEVMVSYHPWVHHLARGSIPWALDLFLVESLVGAEGALVGSQVNQTTMS